MTDDIAPRRWIHGGGATLALALHGAVAWISWRPPARRPVGDEGLYLEAARQWLATGTFDLEPLWPPLYPVFLAALQGLGGVWVLVGAQLALLGLTAWMVRDLARTVLGDRLESELACWLVLLHPTLAAFCHFYWPEILHLTLFTLLVWLLVRSTTGTTATPLGATPRQAVAVGAVLGLALATKALLTPWVPVILAVVAWGGGDRTGRGRRLGWAVLALLVTTLPWVVWNHQRHGVATLSSSARFNLWVGLEDTSRREMVDPVVGQELQAFRAGGATFDERQAVLGEKLGQRWRGQGPWSLVVGQLGKQYHRLFDAETFFTHQLPGGRLASQAPVGSKGYREVPPWLGTTLRHYARCYYLALWGLALVGLTVLRPQGQGWLWGLVAFLLYNLALFLFLHVKTRYRIPWIPGLSLWAVAGIAWLRWRWTPSCDPRPEGVATHRPVWAWALAGMAMATVVLLGV